jgi:ribosomal protein S6
MFIISDTVAGSDWDAAVGHVEGLLKNRNAEILKSEKWEDRKFAYKLKGHKRGAYLLVYFNAPTDSISPLKRDFELSENVLRTLIVKVDKIRESIPEEETGKPVEEVKANDNGADTKTEEVDSTPPEPVASE